MIPFRISKDEVNELPIGHFEGEIVLIEDEKLIDEAVNELKKYTRIGFDTETRPSFRKGVHYDVSLLQLSTPEKAYLFRLNHVGFPKKVMDILEDPNRVKIGAAVRDDIRALKKLNPSFKQASFFDLNEELKKVGFHNVGVRNLSAMVLNIRISKSEQVSNWEAEELTKKQQLYAATDAWACLEIFAELYDKGYLDPLFSNSAS
ncbi:3'-5' exonuclease domain-containing protein 2 [Echinicola sp. CAU 1574]|uniref:3'-5' exonuclease domain-containing protein 2 n=1 Tax=Echinicola arenosa TaxID=2774144 RepID=A0ABR9AEL9_9BACT|nr:MULTISPECIES: 3'-5' exonuclease [Echinicola]MBD8487215.1 3'-5' exonuclease domain-containing protein 2 [Echinicola arenosa]